jgi:1-phosphatidylinositol-4-phosphate 5-kinase
MHGHAVYKWADGQVYEGEYRDGKSNGQGTHKWPSGEIYQGEFKDG